MKAFPICTLLVAALGTSCGGASKPDATQRHARVIRTRVPVGWKADTLVVVRLVQSVDGDVRTNTCNESGIELDPPGGGRRLVESGALACRLAAAGGFPQLVLDGSKLLFADQFAADSTTLVPVHGGSPERFGAPCAETGFSPSLDPHSGAFVLAVRCGGDSTARLSLMLPGAAIRSLAVSVPPAVPGSASWSPTGKELAFEAQTDSECIAVVRVSDGTTRTVTSGSAPSWSPDGRLIAFRRFPAAGGAEIGVVSPARPGGGLIVWRSTESGRRVLGRPLWQPDSKALLISVGDSIAHIQVSP